MIGMQFQHSATSSRTLGFPPPTSSGVLIVDDEGIVRTVLGLYFHQQGNPFWLAADVDEGLRIFENHRDEIGLVLFDLDLPGQGAAQTLLEFKELKPDVACYVTTGDWSDDPPAVVGADGVIVKSLLFQALHVIVETCFAHV